MIQNEFFGSPSSSTLTLTLSMSRYASTGTTVRANTSEASSANVTVSAKGRKNWRHEAADEAERQEHADRGDGRRRDRARDLLGPSMDGGQPVLAQGPVAVDVLEDDDRVVHDASDGDREAAQGHDVEA